MENTTNPEKMEAKLLTRGTRIASRRPLFLNLLKEAMVGTVPQPVPSEKNTCTAASHHT